MLFETWLNEGFLEEHETSPQEIAQLIETIERDLNDAERAKTSGLSLDAQLSIAFGAVKQCAKLALAVCGYRGSRRDGNHYWLIQSLKYTINLDSEEVYILDGFRKKRNRVEYDFIGSISIVEANEMHQLANSLYKTLVTWLKENHPELLQDGD